MEVFGGGNDVVDAEYAEVDPTGRYMRVSFLLTLFLALCYHQILLGSAFKSV